MFFDIFLFCMKGYSETLKNQGEISKFIAHLIKRANFQLDKVDRYVIFNKLKQVPLYKSVEGNTCE